MSGYIRKPGIWLTSLQLHWLTADTENIYMHKNVLLAEWEGEGGSERTWHVRVKDYDVLSSLLPLSLYLLILSYTFSTLFGLRVTFYSRAWGSLIRDTQIMWLVEEPETIQNHFTLNPNQRKTLKECTLQNEREREVVNGHRMSWWKTMTFCLLLFPISFYLPTLYKFNPLRIKGCFLQ
jgi:hypothetical protein